MKYTVTPLSCDGCSPEGSETTTRLSAIMFFDMSEFEVKLERTGGFAMPCWSAGACPAGWVVWSGTEDRNKGTSPGAGALHPTGVSESLFTGVVAGYGEDT